MTHGYAFVKHPVEFVKATTQETQNVKVGNKEVDFPKSSGLGGEEAKNFYENLLELPSSIKSCPEAKQSKRKLRSKRTKVLADAKPDKSTLKNICHKTPTKSRFQPNALDFFKAAEKGLLADVRKILETRLIDIDAADQFSWTALMMASNQGHEDVAKYLLIQGAEWEDKFDGSGYDAYDLACLSGHDRIAHMLKHRKSLIKAEAVQAAHAFKRAQKERLWCEICEVHYDASGDAALSKHESSITHQLSELKKESDMPHSSSFYLGASNKGYNMLKTHGWDGTSGLGPSSSGRKYPVKTVLKRDRTGFGCETDRARVTHFASKDTDAVKHAKRTKLKKLHKKKAEKLKDLEIDFRRSFY